MVSHFATQVTRMPVAAPSSPTLDDETIKTPRIRVFVSYSRRDSENVLALVETLRARELDVLVDVKEILPLEEWRQRLEHVIISADAFIFCLSPSSAASDVCRWEADIAEQFGKRIAPIVIEPIENAQVPAVIGKRNFIFLIGDRPNTIDDIIAALQTDIDWIREHTRLGGLAASWAKAGHPRNRLLHGIDISIAEAWEKKRNPAAPPVTPLQHDFILASRRWATRKATLYAASALLFAVSVAAGSYIWQQQGPLRAIQALNDAGGAVERVTSGVSVTLPRDAKNIPGLLDTLSVLDTVVELDLAGTGIDDRTAAALQRHKGLQRLDLSNNPIGTPGLLHLAALENMDDLDLSGTKITDEGLIALARMPKLRRLTLTGTRIKGSGLAHLSASTALRVLILDRTDLDTAFLERTPLADRLHILSLEGIGLSDSAIPTLSSFRHLNELYLDDNPLKGHTMDSLSVLRLKFLGLSYVLFDKIGFEKISNLVSIDDISLKGANLDDEAFQSICKINLKIIRIPNTPITDQGFACAARHEGLENIYIGSTRISSIGIAKLTNLDKVQNFFFPNTLIDDDVIDILVRMPRLKKIWVNGSRMTLAGISQLRKLRPDLAINTSPNINSEH